MIELVIGGAHQGKTAYVMEKYKEQQLFLLEHENWSYQLSHLLDKKEQQVIVWQQLEQFVWEKEGFVTQIEAMLSQMQNSPQQIVIISNEVGCGIVPIDKKQRTYRNQLGELLCKIAEKAESVERITCGIAEKIR